MIGCIYWIFAVVYAFKVWGIGWGIVNVFLPFAPIMDGFKILYKLHGG